MTPPITIAGIGCRRDCPAADIVAAIRHAEALAGTAATALAAPDFKRHEPGLLAAAAAIGLPLRFIAHADMQAVQQHCPTRSLFTQNATGLASIAEAAALAAAGGPLILPRITHGAATCALAATPAFATPAVAP
jgi:cobalt-precorrin 5A hydrolase